MDANRLADAMGVSPMYRQKETERWNSAMQMYQELLATSGTQTPMSSEEGRNNSPGEMSPVSNEKDDVQRIPTPPNSPSLDGVRRVSGSIPSSSTHLSPTAHNMPGIGGLGALRGGVVNPGVTLSASRTPPLLPFRQMSWTGGMGGVEGESVLHTLELEAVAAVHEMAFAVSSISVSDLLPRTIDLIFVNVTTLEGQPYCLELTSQGWRITSLRLDCMNGDIKHLDLHTRYFESVYTLLGHVSPGYRKQFSTALAERLKQVEKERAEEGEGDDLRREDMNDIVDALAESNITCDPQVKGHPQVRVHHPSGEQPRVITPMFYNPMPNFDYFYD